MERVKFLLKYLLFAYILTGGLLMLLALMVYRFSLSEKIVSIVIIGIYIFYEAVERFRNPVVVDFSIMLTTLSSPFH